MTHDIKLFSFWYGAFFDFKFIFFENLFKPRQLYLQRGWDKSLTLSIKSERNELFDIQNSVLFAFLSNLLILKIYNKEFLKSKSFCPNLQPAASFLVCFLIFIEY